MKHRNFRDEAFHSISTAVGELALAGNDLHLSLADLFWVVLGINNGLIPHAIWNSSNSDRAQRAMLQAVIETRALRHDISDKAREEILFILSKANSLEDRRNNALHSPFIKSDKDAVMPFSGLGNKRAQKLLGKDLLKEFQSFYDTATVLRDYVEDIAEAMRRNNAPWPERPQLPNRGDTNDKKQRL
ncbi:MAG: hypothetical protein EPN26_14200 [Rhodospirillales bacterium]|nr:MAG: hypothetical protein EPN26_14200 [Rhodospirillales bacterium]